MPGSPVVQGGIFAVGLAVGVGAASLLLNKPQQPRNPAPTAVAVPTPVPVGTAPAVGSSPAPSQGREALILSGKTGPVAGPVMASQVATEVFKYGFPGE